MAEQFSGASIFPGVFRNLERNSLYAHAQRLRMNIRAICMISLRLAPESAITLIIASFRSTRLYSCQISGGPDFPRVAR
jgi:hypothetical protein